MPSPIIVGQRRLALGSPEEDQMNINRTTLLAGVAALALTAGTGFASAQQPQKGHNPAPHAAQPHTLQPQPHAAAQPHPSQPMAGRAHAVQPQRANRAAPIEGKPRNRMRHTTRMLANQPHRPDLASMRRTEAIEPTKAPPLRSGAFRAACRAMPPARCRASTSSPKNSARVSVRP